MLETPPHLQVEERMHTVATSAVVASGSPSYDAQYDLLLPVEKDSYVIEKTYTY
jgi:hypothetical protein